MIERRKELALLRAVGYRPEHLRRIVIAENLYVVLEGTLIGIVAALVATLQPLIGRGHAPGFSFMVLLLAVPVAGLIASLGAVRSVVRAPLLETLRSE